MRIEYKKLARGWRYVLSRREIRELYRGIGEELVLVSFDGTRVDHEKHPHLYGAGIVEARRRNGIWYFRLSLEGLRESLLEAVAPDSPSPIDAITNFVSRCRSSAHDPAGASRELRLYYWHLDRKLSLDPSESETSYLGRLLDRADSWLPASERGA